MMRKIGYLLLFLPLFLFAAEKPAAPQQRQTVFIDPGHGGFDLGAHKQSVNEKSLTLSTGLLVRKYLKEKNYRVIMTRMRDVHVSLDHRSTIANRTRSHLFVSIHYNAAKSADAHGIEVFFPTTKDKIRQTSSKKLARLVQNKLVEKTNARDRGIKSGNFHVIRETKMPAILVEGGFITNDAERSKLNSLPYREKLAQAIADGVDAYFKP